MQVSSKCRATKSKRSRIQSGVFASLWFAASSRYPSTPPDQHDAATARAPIETCPPVQDALNRVTKQGTFEWGSFSAFEDGSIELERAGVRQRFRDFSELKRNLNPAWVDEGVGTGTWRLGS